MNNSQRLLDFYLPPEGFVLESFVATTYEVDFEFLEEELLSAALGVRSPTSRMRAFRSELERKLQTTAVSVLYDLGACDRLARLSPRIDPIPIVTRKLHAKITLLMWVRKGDENGGATERRVRLLVGSANLTRQGFRENYECVVSMDFGGRSTSDRSLLLAAIMLVRDIAADSVSPQLSAQLIDFETRASGIAEGQTAADDPLAFVSAGDVVPTVVGAWSALDRIPPKTVRIVSPFWPEGATSVDAMVRLVKTIGVPDRLELVCRGVATPDGKGWLPEFDAKLALRIRQKLSSRLFLYPALPHIGLDDEEVVVAEDGDETEESEFAKHRNGKSTAKAGIQRSLHAKLLLLDGAKGCALYVGSANCTRKGLALGGPSNWEAGVVYRLTTRQRKQLEGVFGFVGPEMEVLPDHQPTTIEPTKEEESVVPKFLVEVTASGTQITIGFRPGALIPSDLRILMPVPQIAASDRYWLLWPNEQYEKETDQVTVELATCAVCDAKLEPIAPNTDETPRMPHVFVEVHWEGHKSIFPVRFDDKASLPLLLIGRKATEGELIEYFLFGREPDDGAEGPMLPGVNGEGFAADSPIDTRRILAYFMRLFIQAIPGIESEIMRATYSRTALDSALRGPTSPLELAERAYGSLSKLPGPDEPQKTPIAVAFQLTEILAALLRCQQRIADAELVACFAPVIARCQELLDSLVASNAELQARGFRLYQQCFAGRKS
jgi:hypothetical protein